MTQQNEIQQNSFDLANTAQSNLIESIDVKDILGFFDVQSTVPAHTPKTLWDSIKIYVNGTDKRLYVYDFTNQTWEYNPLSIPSNIPTADEKAALAGTSGSPSNTNKYVTNDDLATAATASKVVRRGADGAVTVPETPDADGEASSKKYVDGEITTVNGLITTSTNTVLYATASDNTQFRKQSSITISASPNGEQFQVHLSGTIRIKLHIRVASDYQWLSITSIWPNDGSTTMHSHPLVQAQISNTGYQYYNYDIRVRAGEVIQMGLAGYCDDIQINFDVNLVTSGYVIEI